MSIILARSTGGGGTGTGIPSSSATVLASATSPVDTVLTAAVRSTKWLVTVTDVTNDKVVAYEIFATHRSGANPTHTRYAVIGDKNINHSVDVVISGPNIQLEVTNNEAVSLVVDAIRLDVLV